MSRTALPFFAEDISSFARSLSVQLTNCDHTPSHLELLNMLARSTGCRNFQHFRAQHAVDTQPGKPQPVAAPVDVSKVHRMGRFFDAEGRLLRWPGKFSHREPCLWVLWSKLPPRQAFTESQISQMLQAMHAFEDHALLRRMLFDYGMVTRTTDGREYRRIERQPSPEAIALIRHLGARAAD